ncbi:DUF6482 family protein [Marinobacterium lutimaris]|uniref:Uncharacterized protein n=1 Tax=Marinobacterium lutimaris TaxID=568106 RepID=A0A1H5YG47_9GAMM|nr:DUF6482 family protein [Marinobacterium lutimaris]SEG22692.1 hypothetical protein SAMN05444390_1011736 [Marinobacterium lutimaris]
MKITLEQLIAGKVQRLFLRSFENSLYLTEVEMEEGRFTVCDASGLPLKFRNQLDAKKPFKGLRITDTWLLQESAYNEMIGMPSGRVEPLQVKLLNPDQDLS